MENVYILIVGHYEYEKYYGPFNSKKEVIKYRQNMIENDDTQENEEYYIEQLQKENYSNKK